MTQLKLRYITTYLNEFGEERGFEFLKCKISLPPGLTRCHTKIAAAAQTETRIFAHDHVPTTHFHINTFTYAYKIQIQLKILKWNILVFSGERENPTLCERFPLFFVK